MNDFDEVEVFTKRFSDAYDMATKRNPERFMVGGEIIDPKLMLEFQKELRAKKQKPKPVEKPVEIIPEKKKVSLRELLERKRNRGLYGDIFDVIAKSEEL
jgi:hypothetical protein